MIKVNLLRDTTAVGIKKGGTFTAAGTGLGDGTRISGETDNKDVLIKVLLALIPVAGAYGGLMYMESQKLAEVQNIDAMIKAKAAEVTKLAPEIQAVKNFQKEKERLQIQIDTIKSLSRERLRNVKALETLQMIIPEKAWLTSFKIDENKASLEGKAVDDQVVSLFIGALEENIYFANVRLIKSAEQSAKDGVVKVFSLECTLEGL